MPPAGQIASEDGGTNPTPCGAGRTKEAIVVIGNADAQDVAVIGKHGGLAGKRYRGIASVGCYINKGHAASDSGSQWTKIEIHCPVAIAAHVNGSGVQTGGPDC